MIAPTSTDETELFECRATLDSGTLYTGTTGSWMSLDTARAWSVNNVAQDDSTVTAELTIEIRDVATETVQATAAITLTAISHPNPGGA